MVLFQNSNFPNNHIYNRGLKKLTGMVAGAARFIMQTLNHAIPAKHTPQNSSRQKHVSERMDEVLVQKILKIKN